MTRFVLSVFALLAASTFVGCHVMETHYVPGGHHGGWDPVFGSCDSCGTCGGECKGHTPGSHMGHLLTCASGCGEVYWGPWLSDPPDPCDPCDDCGNWIGERCCPPTFCERFFAGLHGARYCDSCGGKGCASCSKGSYGSFLPHGERIGEQIIGGEIISGETESEAEEVLPPTPQPIGPAAAEADQRPVRRRGFQIRSVRYER